VRATRRQLLLAGAATAALPAAARAQAASDVELLEGLLALERRLESAYEAALRRGVIDPTLGETLRDHEREHARGLEKGLAGLGRRAPQASVPPPDLNAALRSRDEFARVALELEAAAVREYVAAAADVRRPGLRQPLGAIMASEAQHAVALRRSLGQPLLGV
jgi:Ferritin-like domain